MKATLNISVSYAYNETINITYKLKSQYSSLKGKFVLMQEPFSNESIIITINKDENNMIANSSFGSNFDVSLSGVNYLTISITCITFKLNSSTKIGAGIVNAYLE